MKKTLILLLSLLLAFALVFVSCDNNPQSQETPKENPQETPKENPQETPEDKPQESEEKKESVGDSVTEEALQKVMESNSNAIAVGTKVKDLIYDPGSYTVEFELKAPEGGTFSFTTDEDYEKLKEYLKNRGDESEALDLVPGKYKYINGKIAITKADENNAYSFTYKEKDKEEVTLTSAKKCQLLYDVMIIDFISHESTEDENGNEEYITDFAIALRRFFTLASSSPEVTGTIKLTRGTTEYELTVGESLSLEDGTMLIDNDLTLKEGNDGIVSLKCKAKVTLSDDFKYKYHTVEKKSEGEYTYPTYEHYTELGGSVAVSLYDINLTVKDAVLTGSIKASADYDNMEGSLELSLAEKIGDKDIAALELALDVKNVDELTEGSIVEYLINNVKIYKFEIEEKSYSAESVRAFIKTALGMTTSESEA